MVAAGRSTRARAGAGPARARASVRRPPCPRRSASASSARQATVQVTGGVAPPPSPETRNPKLAEAPGDSVPFHPTFRAVTVAPLWETVAFQDCATTCPPPRVNVAVHDVVVAVVSLRTLTSP